MDNVFQAAGAISGKVLIKNEEGKEKIYINIETNKGTKQYRIFCCPKYRRTLLALKLEIKNHGDK